MKRSLHVLLLVVFLVSCGSPSKPVLNLFTWSLFFSPELIAEFEKKYGCTVVIDVFDSNESMYAKLKLGSSAYDLVFPSNYYLEILRKQGMIRPVHKELVPNLKNLDPQYFKGEDPPLGVPYLVSFSGIAYRKDRIPDLAATYKVFDLEKYRGRMTMLNDPREALGAALKTLGHSINTKNAEEVTAAADLLLHWKRNLAKFESEQFKNGIASSEFLIVQGYSNDIMQVQQEDEEVAFLFPKEGAILSIDCMTIPTTVQNAKLAHAFINFMLSPEAAAKNMTYSYALIPVVPAYELLEPNMRRNSMLFPPQEALEKMELIQDLGSDINLYFKAWDKVKAG